MKWDFWHVVLALVIALLGAFLIWELVSGVVHAIEAILTPVLVVVIIAGLAYLGYRMVAHRT